ncbi:hypothetical protein K2173_017313 [Erythroxylum novogranatense]|uniref:Uncharacterized protein n=1 Tax=Erythroxylum novogranatense TaxID=1862640 RepID=A0AAV8TMD2_9ROSI|nr:hypothetical protein K2173_017313 [Erythroxylum novogranatense]
MRLGERNQLWEDSIAVSYHCKPTAKTHTSIWIPTGKVFNTGSYYELMNQVDESHTEDNQMTPAISLVTPLNENDSLTLTLALAQKSESCGNIDIEGHAPVVRHVVAHLNEIDSLALAQQPDPCGHTDVEGTTIFAKASHDTPDNLFVAADSPLCFNANEVNVVIIEATDQVMHLRILILQATHHPFRFNHYLAKEPGFREACMKGNIHDYRGTKQFVCIQKLKAIKQELKILKSSQGSTVEAINNIILELTRMHNLLSPNPANQLLIDKEKLTLTNYLQAVSNHSSFLQQRARINWLQEGDNCT